MDKAQIRLYRKQFDAEMAAMSVPEYQRWNPRHSEDEAAYRIALAIAAVSKNGTIYTHQKALF